LDLGLCEDLNRLKMGSAGSKEEDGTWDCMDGACKTRGAEARVVVADARGKDHGLHGGAHAQQVEEPQQDPSPTGFYVSGPPPQDQSWRLNPASDSEAVGIGAYFGRVDGQTDAAARVIRIVRGGAAEQCGEIQLGDALCAVDDVPVYGRPLCELGKYVLGTSGTVVKLTFERGSGHVYNVQLVRGRGVLTVM